MLSCKITIDTYSFPVGNFGVLKDSGLPSHILERCLEAESKVFTDYLSCADLLRSAFEYLGYDIECRHRIQDGGAYQDMPYEDVLAKLLEEMTSQHKRTPGKNKARPQIMNAKQFIKNDLTREKSGESFVLDAKGAGEDYINLFSGQQVICADGLNSYVDCLFHFYAKVSDVIHKAEASEAQIQLLLEGFYYIVSAYYRLPAYDIGRCPYEQYVPVPGTLYEELGLLDEPGLDVYVKKEKGHLGYYLLKSDMEEPAIDQARDLDVVHRLWMDSEESPNNVLYLLEKIGQGSCVRQVYSFKGRPYTLEHVLKAGISLEEKDEIFGGMLKAVYSLHGMESPLAHRTLNPCSFYVCAHNGHWRTVLIRFDSVKDLMASSSQTVIGQIHLVLKNTQKRAFLSPELVEGKQMDSYLPSDIYSLGSLMQYLYCGASCPENLADMPVDLRKLSKQMLESNPKKRPDIMGVWERFRYIHTHHPMLVVGSKKGTKHRRQEDAYCMSNLEQTQDVQCLECVACVLPVYAGVLDGIGAGEAGDEISVAGALACKQVLDASILENTYSKRGVIKHAVHEINEAVFDFIEENDFFESGTTLAGAIIDGNEMHYASVGDSRIYRIHDGKLTLLTEDHRYEGSHKLYQWIGFDESELELEPCVGKCELEEDDFVLLCTDGLSDYVNEPEIASILNRPVWGEEEAKQAVESLIDLAISHGSKDDITMILYGRGI